ncbi:type IV pilus twitching motility protein PilT [Jeotgalibacillus salarius]|uniref:Type IV pilus twitching motility protein PilT n=1 Tax=Jeotgalibacillus salarius TaxID=546023 RepID=A0A4Y8LFL5_9BACL|nr:type IV pilus twitching motility protein PilT [Jeotgalibacillus salarius]TFE01016.1 type IV pilus twitching motility protein PilT [Jeotgalibacillus salarius]
MKEEIHYLLKTAFELGASDMHLTVGSPPVLRIDGSLKRLGKDKLKMEHTENMAEAIFPEGKWDDFKEKGELDFSYGLPGVSRFRINVYHQRNCISLAVRVIPTSIPTLKSLQLPSVLEDIAHYPQGLVLVTGPTGSGKSTTLASMIQYINQTEKKHIITLEDPIEYLHSHSGCIIDQREVGYDTKTFANGLRSALRQDPDIILVGEMRDLETIQTAITAAETGHLVFATLHTSSAASTVERIIDVFPPEQQPQIRLQLASVLKGVISQRLLPLKEKKGRIAAVEIMTNNAAVANLIRTEKVHQLPSVIQTSMAQGMQLIQSSVKELYDKNMISQETAKPYM